ncbi:MAG: GTP-binding protein, partial [Candidatus Heimdallarchaeota archaeon]|nr:GTP-binding protein [Candidatus Heimdallarchaeota archaeon]MDH5645737.1 GTP-binding protein [Candidatus Heimdallarchaeota archaeon]
MKSLSNEIKIKVILLGDGAVGKTSIANRYTHDKFSSTYKPSLGVDFMVKRVEVDSKKIKVMVFDTAGQEFISTLRKRYYSGATGAVIVFDVTREKTFQDLDRWVEEVKNEVGDIQTIFVGNKIDLSGQRVISKKDAEEFATKNNGRYIESSALIGEGIGDIFEPFVLKTIAELQ